MLVSLSGFFFSFYMYVIYILYDRQKEEYYEINKLLKAFILKVVLISVAFIFKNAERL